VKPGLDICTPDFHRNDSKLRELIDLLRLSNEIPESKRQRLTPYLAAGRQILQAPSVEDDLWDRLLVQPLKEIIAEAPLANVGKIACEFLDWLIDAVDRQ